MTTTDRTVYATDLVAFRRLTSGIVTVLLIRRGYAPHRGAWALPGGYVEPDETSRQAAAREAAEETGAQVEPEALHFVGVYDEPERDERGRVISAAWMVDLSEADAVTVTAGDDAAEAAWFAVDDALSLPLAFDHGDIITAARNVLLALRAA